MELKTLTRDDPEFEAYLLGTFANDRRAIPIETSFVETSRERVTFRIVPLAKMKIPKWWIIYLRATRPELLALTLGPALATWLNHRGDAAWTHWPAWTSLLGIFFLHVSVFLFNDVEDHVRGSDRLNRRRGDRIIQRGWTTAAAMRGWAKVNLGLAIACGLPAAVNAPAELLFVCLGATAALFVILRKWGTRFGLVDLAVASLFGPLLTTGVAWSAFGTASVSDLSLGVAFGLTTLWVFQVRQFEGMFRARPESFRTFLGYLNFDGARLTCATEGLSLLALMPAAAVIVRVPLIFLVVLPIFGLPLVFRVNRIFRAASPLSSELTHSSRAALIAHLSFTVWWVLALGTTWL